MRHLEAEALRTVARATTGNRISDEEDLFDLVPDNESHHFHLDSSFTSAYEQELRAILESPLSSLSPSPIVSPLPGPSTPAADLWQRLSQANPANQATATWDTFREECYGFYPKSNETHRYMPAHLEEAARILRASPISTLDEFGHFDRYIQNIGLDVTAGTSPLMSKHEYMQMYISTIHPMLRMMIDQWLAVLFPKPEPSRTLPCGRG